MDFDLTNKVMSDVRIISGYCLAIKSDICMPSTSVFINAYHLIPINCAGFVLPICSNFNRQTNYYIGQRVMCL